MPNDAERIAGELARKVANAHYINPDSEDASLMRRAILDKCGLAALIAVARAADKSWSGGFDGLIDLMDAISKLREIAPEVLA